MPSRAVGSSSQDMTALLLGKEGASDLPEHITGAVYKEIVVIVTAFLTRQH